MDVDNGLTDIVFTLSTGYDLEIVSLPYRKQRMLMAHKHGTAESVLIAYIANDARVDLLREALTGRAKLS